MVEHDLDGCEATRFTDSGSFLLCDQSTAAVVDGVHYCAEHLPEDIDGPSDG